MRARRVFLCVDPLASSGYAAAMATDTLLNAMVRENRVTVGAAAGIRASINRAYAAVESPEGYNPGTFRTALVQAARSIEALR